VTVQGKKKTEDPYRNIPALLAFLAILWSIPAAVLAISLWIEQWPLITSTWVLTVFSLGFLVGELKKPRRPR
jgi:fatty acid desaturase